ncbi:uncharacterized protein LOC119998158 isoform X2 [Tripterygium wilfordii]|uniref:uncharacterized protein LOC119998158 isoform X2 n=1 Tax=Tripterygium wilfordii TaxID=458696 RepID=UPI0018F80E61|nr:uncharacterized protein LOC119998158 isoform X2 [Tripterygium wilfordii]
MTSRLAEKQVYVMLVSLVAGWVVKKLERTFRILKDFMASVTKLEELGNFGSRLLSGFQQALELLRRPPINTTSKLIDNIIKANDTKRVKSYIATGCINNHDMVQNMSKSKSTLDALESLVEDVADVMKS